MEKKETPTYDPDILSRVSTLKIRALNLVEGLLSGNHRSRHKGSSVEFAEYKDYTPGDEIRHIDWKVVGKTDKYHVKQFEQSTNLKCTILLDASGSMGYVSPDQTGMTKMEYAKNLAACLTCIFLKQFDAVGLTLFNDRIIQHIPPRSKASHFQHILHGLEAMEPGGVTRIDRVIDKIVERLPSHGMLILISDLLARNDNVAKDLKLLRSRGLEVILFHILHPDEVSLPFEGDILFESLEDDPVLGLDPQEIREEYQKLVRGQIEEYRKTCLGLGVDYIFLETTIPLDQALSYYLLRRQSLSKA
ncbi:MAG: DUF58 domain-containing protein [Nitrospinaceae bacterium]